jgi:hypothetical protein
MSSPPRGTVRARLGALASHMVRAGLARPEGPALLLIKYLDACKSGAFGAGCAVPWHRDEMLTWT